jgi:EthD domain
MIKMVLLLKRRAGMSFEDFKRYYETRHAVLGASVLPHAARYRRNFLQPMGDAAPDAYDCITEVWFENQADMDASLAFAQRPDNAARLAEDEEKLFDRSKIRFYVIDSECESELKR